MNLKVGNKPLFSLLIMAVCAFNAASCSNYQSQSAVKYAAQSNTTAPAEVIFIRHGEKPEQGDDLNDQGYQRANLLVDYFESNPNVTRFGTPVAIYAMARSHKDHGSLRAIETVAPLAKALNVALNTNYKKEDYETMANEILNNPDYAGKMVLICWEHNVLPNAVAAFGYADGPQSWNGGQYFNRTWILDFTNNTPTSFNDYNQKLLPGDK